MHANPKQNNHWAAIHAMEQPEYETRVSSIPYGKIDDAISRAPIDTIHRKMGCDAIEEKQ